MDRNDGGMSGKDRSAALIGSPFKDRTVTGMGPAASRMGDTGTVRKAQWWYGLPCSMLAAR